jgi:hypothetical protein
MCAKAELRQRSNGRLSGGWHFDHWLARLLGIPIKQRAAGSDIFDALQAQEFLLSSSLTRRMNVLGNMISAPATAC